MDHIDRELGKLDDSGRPRKPNSIMIGVRRRHAQPVAEAVEIGDDLILSVKSIGDWEFVIGLVVNVSVFPEGRLIAIRPEEGGCMIPYNGLIGWRRAYLWVPNTGACGILN